MHLYSTVKTNFKADTATNTLINGCFLADALAEAAERQGNVATTLTPQMPSPPSSAPRPVLKPTDNDGTLLYC